MNNIQEFYKAKYDELFDLLNNQTVLEKMKNNVELNRNIQYQIYLLTLAKFQLEDCKNMLDFLKSSGYTINFFNEYLSPEQIESLLESNAYNFNKQLEQNPQTNPEEIKQNLVNQITAISNEMNQNTKLKEDFLKAKQHKWFKKICNKAMTYISFLWVSKKKKEAKFKALFNQTLNEFAKAFNYDVATLENNKIFIKLFIDEVYTAALKKVLIILLSCLVALLAIIVIILIALNV